MGTRERKGRQGDAGKVVGYVRTSTRHQAYSLESQREAIEAYARENGATVVVVYSETESGRRSDRPRLAEAIAMAKAEGAELVIARLDRLSRDVEFLFALRRAGVRFLALDLPEVNTLTLAVVSGMAQHEREIISARVKAGLEQARKAGKALGGIRACRSGEGRNVDKATVKAARVRRERAIVSSIEPANVVRVLLQDGHSLAAIAERLAAMKIPTARGGHWHKATVANLIRLHGIGKGGQSKKEDGE